MRGRTCGCFVKSSPPLNPPLAGINSVSDVRAHKSVSFLPVPSPGPLLPRLFYLSANSNKSAISVARILDLSRAILVSSLKRPDNGLRFPKSQLSRQTPGLARRDVACRARASLKKKKFRYLGCDRMESRGMTEEGRDGPGMARSGMYLVLRNRARSGRTYGRRNALDETRRKSAAHQRPDVAAADGRRGEGRCAIAGSAGDSGRKTQKGGRGRDR
jgi:hypothetical protein